ncbi:inositol polyphosphate 5-phosphatase K-like isoform X1 [Erpetoichthys calabaricus]|uniref:inositol polyphosphate 5-phosphatase K-like isoform X1 n=2 Tax=Erpetoichthys calabaricus TaxID=27687 RepID=UPI002234E714|nr:inositol polyphosphate 5-phosphatase K-like isoform X1 [Erpetoichthys calabaricus]XP_051786199.1 inositol polyphosphate 5-phosphatase K-like isoform X1 [Erpetoichthys calabaricus]
MDIVSSSTPGEHRVRSESCNSATSQSSSVSLLLRQRMTQLMACVEDLSSDEEIQEEMSRTLDEAFSLCAKKSMKEEVRFRFHIVTWNVATAQPPDDVSSLLQLDADEPIVDLYIIGLQEVNSKILNFVNDMAFEDPWSIFIMDTLSPFGYVKLTSVRMQGLLLLVFSKLCHIPFIREVQASYTRTGIYGYWGNKGGVSVRMSFYGHLICFLNCHLAAHMEYASQRVDEIERILDVQEFHGNSSPKILDHKVVFLFGDLNFRIADHGMHFLRETINNRRFHLLWDKDQLNIAKKKEHFLKNFQEGPLRFKPTYKYDLNSENFDSREQKTWLGFNGKKRKPAWTDRILWWMKVDDQNETEEAREQQKTEENTIEPKDPEPPITVIQEKYTSHMIYGISDHKPVTGTFILEMKKLQTTPLVSLCAEGQWSADQDALITYSVLEAFSSSTWDWIGLYKTGFRSHLDYVTYVWVKDDEVSSSSEAYQVYIGMDQIPVLGGEFILCYYSSNLQCIIGMSPSFQINESCVNLHENQSFAKSQDRPVLDPKDDF